ncbi:hypothetical protein EI94DRAFT_1817216 [Lactarius quietus]|nr:hypothetical protein EI94DRAFT_1817216 [Lactarius quietus]
MALVGSRPRRNRLDPSQSRDSNCLRASVLEVALELGINQSRAVADLIFNTVDEEDDHQSFSVPDLLPLQDLTTPALTSASAATSDENSQYSPSVPPWNAVPPQFVFPAPQSVIVAPPPAFDTQSTRAPSEESSHAPSSLRPNQPRKLRKARKDDGYDSDGGYLSDSSKKKKKSKDRKNAGSTSHEADFLSDGGYLSDATKRTSDKKKDKKGDKATNGYVTDSSTKTQQKLSKKSRQNLDDGEFSDGGYLSEVSVKKKKTFFRIGSRSPSTSRKSGSVSNDSLPPPVPALPPQPLPIAERYARSPIPFEQADGLGSAAPSIRTAYSPVPPSVDESMMPLTSAFGRDWSPPPPSDSVRTATRPPSAALSLENLTSSSTSHEASQFSSASPVSQFWEAVPYTFPPARSRETEGRALSPGSSSHEHLSAAPVALRPHGVRFTPSTRFSPSDSSFSIPPPPPEGSFPSERPGRQPRPKISLPITSTLNSNPSSAAPSPSPLHSILRNAPPMSSPPDSRPFLSPAPRSRAANPPFLRGASPSRSDFSIISSSDFIVPSPRPRFFDELPPPSPPPTGPLPEVPNSSGLYSQPIPSIKRGREAPFPARGVLPADEASRIIESTLRARREALLARLADSETDARAVEMVQSDNGHGNGVDASDVGVDVNVVPDLPWLAAETAPMPPPSPPPEQQPEEEQDWPDDESVRPDIAQFYLYESNDNIASGSKSGDVVARRRSPDAPHDERSTYTNSFVAPSARGDIESYYFGVPDAASDDGVDNNTEAQSRASFVDDERSQGMRARLIARVDALYGAEKLPPVPKLRRF